MGSMKYLWVSLGRSNKMRIALFHEFRAIVMEIYFINSGLVLVQMNSEFMLQIKVRKLTKCNTLKRHYFSQTNV